LFVFSYPPEYPVHLINAVPQDYILRLGSLGDKAHVILHLSSQVWLVEFYSEMLISFYKIDPYSGGNEILILLHSIVALLHCLDVLVNGSICPDSIAVHLRNKVSFSQKRRRFGLTISHLELRDKFFTLGHRRENGIRPLLIVEYF
jgi:hypothetical protein